MLAAMRDPSLMPIECHVIDDLADWLDQYLVTDESGEVPLEKRLHANVLVSVVMVGLWYVCHCGRLPTTEEWAGLVANIGMVLAWAQPRINLVIKQAGVGSERWDIADADQPDKTVVADSFLEQVRSRLRRSLNRAIVVQYTLEKLPKERWANPHLN